MARRKKQIEDQPQENLDSSDDTFGLPEIEYEPLKREPLEEEIKIQEPTPPEPEPEPEPEPQPSFAQEEPPLPKEEEQPKKEYVEENQFYQPSYSYSDQDEERPAVWPKVLGFLLVLVIAGAAIWYFVKIRPESLAKEAREKREQIANQEEERKNEAERQARLRAEEEQKQAAAVATAKPTEGSIETLSGRSGRYYVVVASSIDDDLIMDYAKKLSKKGVATKIIPAFGKNVFHRLAVAEGDTYANTQATADGMKGGEYGDKIWVIKY